VCDFGQARGKLASAFAQKFQPIPRRVKCLTKKLCRALESADALLSLRPVLERTYPVLTMCYTYETREPNTTKLEAFGGRAENLQGI
jgi:hypothetical protein